MNSGSTKNVSLVKSLIKSFKFDSLSGFIVTWKLNEEEYEGLHKARYVNTV